MVTDGVGRQVAKKWSESSKIAPMYDDAPAVIDGGLKSSATVRGSRPSDGRQCPIDN